MRGLGSVGIRPAEAADHRSKAFLGGDRWAIVEELAKGWGRAPGRHGLSGWDHGIGESGFLLCVGLEGECWWR